MSAAQHAVHSMWSGGALQEVALARRVCRSCPTAHAGMRALAGAMQHERGHVLNECVRVCVHANVHARTHASAATNNAKGSWLCAHDKGHHTDHSGPLRGTAEHCPPALAPAMRIRTHTRAPTTFIASAAAACNCTRLLLLLLLSTRC